MTSPPLPARIEALTSLGVAISLLAECDLPVTDIVPSQSLCFFGIHIDGLRGTPGIPSPCSFAPEQFSSFLSWG